MPVLSQLLFQHRTSHISPTHHPISVPDIALHAHLLHYQSTLHCPVLRRLCDGSSGTERGYGGMSGTAVPRSAMRWDA
eukprot:386374-Rhodomonas_salina.2